MNVRARNTGQVSWGITGLETAIILIAFVVVASIFGFTVLSLGVFSSERSKETIHAGVEDTKTTLSPKGSAVAEAGNVAGGIVQLRRIIPSRLSTVIDLKQASRGCGDTATRPRARAAR